MSVSKVLHALTRTNGASFSSPIALFACPGEPYMVDAVFARTIQSHRDIAAGQRVIPTFNAKGDVIRREVRPLIGVYTGAEPESRVRAEIEAAIGPRENAIDQLSSAA